MDMEQLVQGFMDEAAELIIKMEESLLVLEQDAGNKESIDSVFRVMHTLKGSGGMFGFTSVTSFTHLLENIYDKIRADKLQLSKEILDLTFNSVDLIKNLLLSTNEPEGEVKKTYDFLIQQFKQITDSNQTSNTSKPQEASNRSSNIEEKPSYYIHFLPNKKTMQNGTNPLYLIDELIELGEGKAFVYHQNIPTFQKFNPSHLYCSWDIIISTESDLSEIIDVFIFVEDDCTIDIQKISDSNVLNNPNFIEQAANILGKIDESSISSIQELIEDTESVSKIKPVNSVNEQIVIGNKPTESLESTPPVIAPASIEANTDPSPIKPIKRSNINNNIRVSSKKIETLINLVSEMVTSQARLNLLAKKSKDDEIIEVTEALEKLTRQLRDNAFEISLIPISSLITRFQRLIRDLSNELNKEIEFTTEGVDTELDKTIIESLVDPIMHIFRNALDHGFENADERTKAGKKPKGTLKFKAYYSGTNVFIDISDDGRGINTNIVKQKALEKGLISPSDQLNEKQLTELILLPGFSTTDTVTNLSGRGVGMDVVKKNINKIQGEISIISELGVGTTFSLKLPLTLSIIDGLLVVIEDIRYIIPILVIHKIKPVKHHIISNSFNNMIIIDGEQIPMIYLREKFNIKETPFEQEEVVVVNYEQKKVGLVIDRVIEESQVVVKSIGKHFQDQEIVSGASSMGDGHVALVLDTNKIIEKYSN